MRQIRDMSIMEIDITNACQHRCSNCTRFCGHHTKPFFMDFETFKRAVDSLKGFGGLISTIGGEPLLHPEYNRFADYLYSAGNGPFEQMNDGRCKALVKDYLSFAKAQRWFQGSMNRGRGNVLFTSMPRNYYSRYEAIEGTVTNLWLNDHTNPSFHQPILVSRKDLGIGDEEFAVLRDNCWLQNYWSASITPKGAFFCEIAGTLDMLFHGSGGKKIEPGWWNRDLSEFEDQFHWCDICGMALTTYSRSANDELDDASPTLMEKLRAVESPKLLRDHHVLAFDIGNADSGSEHIGADMNSVSANYLPENEKRVGSSASYLKPASVLLGCAVRSSADIDGLHGLIRGTAGKVDGIRIATVPALKDQVHDAMAATGCKNETVTVVDESAESFGVFTDSLLQELGEREWLILTEGDAELPKCFSERISAYFANPGYLFILNETDSAVMFSPLASALRKNGRDILVGCAGLRDLISLWGEKVCRLNTDFENVPDMDIPFFINQVKENYLADESLKKLLCDRLTELGIRQGDNVLLLQSAFVYHTLGIYYILTELGYCVSVYSSEKFREYFKNVVDERRLYFFPEGAIEYDDRQKALRDWVRSETAPRGAVVPFSFGPSTVKPIDDYTRALRTAEDIGGRILAIINIRRELIEPEYDIWSEEVN